MGLMDAIRPLPVPGVTQPDQAPTTQPDIRKLPKSTRPLILPLPTQPETPQTPFSLTPPPVPQPIPPRSLGGQVLDPKFRASMFKKGSAVMDHFTSLGGNPTYTGPRIAAGGNRILQVADTQLGVPYVFGALDPAGGGSSAIDCSGLTKYVFSKVGITLPHSAAEQSQMFPKVGQSGLKPGDLVFYDYGRLGGASDHVAIYAGNGMQVAASSSAGRVELQPVDWGNFIWGGSVPTGGRKPNTTRRQPKPTVSRAETNARRGRQT